MGTLSGILRVCFPHSSATLLRDVKALSPSVGCMREDEMRGNQGNQVKEGWQTRLDAFKLKHDSQAAYTAPCQHLVTSLENIWALCLQKYAHNLFLIAIKIQECWQVWTETQEAMINIVSYKNWEATLKIINIVRLDEMSNADAMNHPSLGSGLTSTKCFPRK